MTREAARPKKRRWFRWLVLLVLVGVAVYVYSRLSGAARIEPNTVLVVDLRSDVPERSELELLDFVRPSPVDVMTLRRALRAARADPRIPGLLLRVSATTVGMGRLEELGRLLEDFRRSRKPILCYAEGPDTLGYYMATSADEIWLETSARLNALGLSLGAFFLKDAIGEWGVEADLLRAGEYKGTFEQLTASQPSEAFNEAMNSLADSLFQVMVRRMAGARKLDEGKVLHLIDRAPLKPEEAKEEGLVDQVIHRADLMDRLEARFGSHVKLASVSTYIDAVPHRTDPEPKIALVWILGVLVEGSSQSTPLFGVAAGADTIVKALRDAEEDATIAGVLLRIDSPGGVFSAAEKVWQQVRRTARVKPVVASLGETAASGGYYVASAASWIVCHPGSLTGSIGVFGGKVVLEKLLQKHGVGVARYERGRNAGLFDMTRAFTAEERVSLQEQVDESYRTFVDRVAEGRGKSAEAIEQLARGRVWSGEQALEHGLADEEGGIAAAARKISSLAKLGDAEPELAPFPPPPGLWELLGGASGSELARGPRSSREGLVPTRLEQVRWLQRALFSGRSSLALMPFWLAVQ